MLKCIQTTNLTVEYCDLTHSATDGYVWGMMTYVIKMKGCIIVNDLDGGGDMALSW